MTQTNSYNSEKIRKPFDDEAIKAGHKKETGNEMTDEELEAVKMMPALAVDLELKGKIKAINP